MILETRELMMRTPDAGHTESTSFLPKLSLREILLRREVKYNRHLREEVECHRRIGLHLTDSMTILLRWFMSWTLAKETEDHINKT